LRGYKTQLLVTRAGEPEPHDLAGTGAETILFFLQEPEHFKKIGMEPEMESELAQISAALRLQQFL